MINLPQPLPLPGLEVTWGEAPKSVRLEERDAQAQRTTLADDPDALGETVFLSTATPRAFTTMA
ncbi:MAG: hypothetical protein JSS25_07960 [Proteobacteria bacterium]|nr:hypothetical protein [Pseudomonadota bacterium]